MFVFGGRAPLSQGIIGTQYAQEDIGAVGRDTLCIGGGLPPSNS